MNSRTLGLNGPQITEIGLGAWAIGGPWEYGWGKVDDEISIQTIHRALDLGINWIDTAAVYGLGHSEKVIARAIKGIRKKVFIATKCGMVWDKRSHVTINASPTSIRNEIENSLSRLQTDYIDLYQIHWPDPETPVEDSWGTLVSLKQEGKVKYIGVCNFDKLLLEKCNSISQVQSLQPPYSLLRRKIESEIMPYCLKNNIGIVAYSPMQAGLLSGKFDINKLASDDWRRNNQYYREPFLSKALHLINELKPIAAQYKLTVGQLAVAWVLNHQEITSAIVGARKKEQVEENVKSSEIKIESEDKKLIEKLLDELKHDN